jgi:hypothetical protein
MAATTAETRTWQEIGAGKRAAVLGQIPTEWLLPKSYLENIGDARNVLGVPRECGILTAEELAITEDNDAVSLTQKLATGGLSAVAVTTAFCKRAAIATQLVRSD